MHASLYPELAHVVLLVMERGSIEDAMKTLDVSQATAAAQAGGILSAILRAEGGHFLIEFETRTAGPATLVTSNARRPRCFRNPLKALEMIRTLGVQSGRFSLEEWRPDESAADRPVRPDRARALKATHERAAAYDDWIRSEVQAAIDDPSPAISHSEVMSDVRAEIAAMRKSKRART